MGGQALMALAQAVIGWQTLPMSALHRDMRDDRCNVLTATETGTADAGRLWNIS